ncbi:MAG TPA: GntR family transcriptional regulator [Devosiaceae bacterium]|jgi:DNA-binding GntR family transcriptional regulator
MDEVEDLKADSSEAGKRGSSRSRATHVYDQLRDWIREGRLAPGTRVREEDLARSLDVSRTPVREALSRLQARGLVEMSGGGLSVVELTRPQIMELYAVRAVLEGSAARFAAENASASDIATLQHVASQFDRFTGDAKGFARVNAAFHQAIYEAAHNRYQMRMLEDLNDSLSLLPSTTFMVAGRSQAAMLEHRGILTAIENKDMDGAEQAARRHIRNALQARLELLFAFR